MGFSRCLFLLTSPRLVTSSKEKRFRDGLIVICVKGCISVRFSKPCVTSDTRSAVVIVHGPVLIDGFIAVFPFSQGTSFFTGSGTTKKNDQLVSRSKSATLVWLGKKWS